MSRLSRYLLTLWLLSMGAGTAMADWYRPGLHTQAHIQLRGKLNSSYPVDLYDIDLFDTSRDTILSLKNAGAHVICYFSAGSYENWRPDAAQFMRRDLGRNLSGWPGERWLDIRSANVRRIMKARLDLAVAKGCDGVDPDNVDGYTNKSGFRLSAAHQLAYNRFLAQEAHQRGLAIGLKNDLDQVKALVGVFDFSVNEQCHQYSECDLLKPFITAGKPVFNLEYQQRYVDDLSAQQTLCVDANALGFNTLVVPYLLDGSFRLACRS